MRLIKSVLLLFLFCLAFCFTEAQQNQYVQPFQFRDNSAPWQFNVGGGRLKFTHPSAFLEIGDSANSKKGFLPPRGNKDSIQNPAKGLELYDLPTNRPKWFDGVKWNDYGKNYTFLAPFKNQNDTVSINLKKYIDSAWVANDSLVLHSGDSTYKFLTGKKFVDTLYKAINGLDLVWIKNGNPYTLSNAFANLYNSNGTLTGSRTITLNNNNINFWQDGFNRFAVNPNGIYSINFDYSNYYATEISSSVSSSFSEIIYAAKQTSLNNEARMTLGSQSALFQVTTSAQARSKLFMDANTADLLYKGKGLHINSGSQLALDSVETGTSSDSILVIRNKVVKKVAPAALGGSGSSYTDADARAAISLTTTGTSGAATYNSSTGVLNIPQYSSGSGSSAWADITGKPNSGNFIYNQNATDQTANFSIAGQGKIYKRWTSTDFPDYGTGTPAAGQNYLELWGSMGGKSNYTYAMSNTLSVVGFGSSIYSYDAASSGNNLSVIGANLLGDWSAGTNSVAIDASATATNLYNLTVKTSIGGSVTNYKALYIPANSAGATPSDYRAISQEDGSAYNYFAGKMLVGSSISQGAFTIQNTGNYWSSGTAVMTGVAYSNLSSLVSLAIDTLTGQFYRHNYSYTLPVASDTTLGGIIASPDFSVDPWGGLTSNTWTYAFGQSNTTNHVYIGSGGYGNTGYNLNVDGTTKINGQLYFQEYAAPATPYSGSGVLYAKPDGKLYYKNSAGVEYTLTN